MMASGPTLVRPPPAFGLGVRQVAGAVGNSLLMAGASALSVPESRLRSIFVPQHCLQGEEFPTHILWSGGGQVQVEVTIPAEIELKEIFNIRRDTTTTVVAGMLSVRAVEVPGYLGLLFKAK